MPAIDPMRPPAEFGAEHAGVLIPLGEDPGHGQEYVAGLVVIMASRLGHRSRMSNATTIAYNALNGQAHGWTDDRADKLFELAEDAADWLTEHHAPPRHCFDFTDEGAFMLRVAAISDPPAAPGSTPKSMPRNAFEQMTPTRVPPAFHGQSDQPRRAL